MAEALQYDVFLSHSSKDKPVVRAIAERLRADGVKVWFDELVLKPGDSIPAKIEERLGALGVLVRSVCRPMLSDRNGGRQVRKGINKHLTHYNKQSSINQHWP